MNKITHINEIILEIDEDTYDAVTYGEKIMDCDILTVLRDYLKINVTDVIKFKYLGQDWEDNSRTYRVKYI